MKKVVGKSLALGAIALGLISLLGGSNVFSVLGNIKFPSKSKKQETPVKEAEKTEVNEEEKTEEVIDSKGKEIALEEAPQETPKQEPRVEEPVKQVETRQEEVKVEKIIEPVQETQAQAKPVELPKPKPLSSRIKKLPDNITEYTTRSGEKVVYKWRKPVWRSTKGRLTETPEERKWKESYVSPFSDSGSGKKGTGIWCSTLTGVEQVEDKLDCPKGSKKRNNRN